MLILICGLVFSLRPIPFDTSFDYIVIGYTQHNVDINGKPVLQQDSFTFYSQDAEFAQIKEILSKHSYHRGLTTLFRNTISWEGMGYSLSIGLVYDGRDLQGMSITKSPYIIIGSKVYRVGYWGSTKVVALGNEIMSVLTSE